MKRKLVFPVVFCMLLLTIIGVSSAADSILDFFDFVAAQDDTFGFSSSDKLAIKDVSTSSVDVEFPIIKKWSRDVTAYLFVAYWCFYNLDEGVTVNWTKVRVPLDTSSLDRNQTYYLYATPIDWLMVNGENGSCTSSEVKEMFDNWVLWKESIVNWEDPCFKIEWWIYWEKSYCDNHSSSNWWTASTNWWTASNNWWTTSSNVGVYAIRNVSHTYNWSDIRLTWESLGADVNVEIFLWYDSENTFKKIWDVNSEKKSFTFKAVHNWDHIVKLKPADGYQDINYTAHYLQTTNPEVKPVDPVKPVVVWPKENIMMILFWTLILYIVYRVAIRKRS